MVEPAKDKRTLSFWHFVVLALLCILAFWPMFRNGFVFDDLKFIVGNHAIRGLWPVARFFQAQGSMAKGSIYPLSGERPVMVFSLALDYALWKLNPFGYHLTNLLLHLLCVFGVAGLAGRLSRSRGAAFLTGALFALHPGHAEGVIAFLGRSDLLATLFVLSGFWGYVQGIEAKGKWKTIWYAGTLVCFLIACFSKESGLVLLGVLVIYEGFVLGKPSGAWGQRALRLLPFFLAALFYWGYRGRVLGGQAAGSEWWGGSPGKNFLMAFEVYARYVRLLFFPVALSPSYRIPVPASLWDARVLWGLGLLLGTLGGMVWGFRTRPKAGFLASWFVLGLIPVANIIPIPQLIMAERWLYLPSVGVCALGGWGAWALYGRAKGRSRAAWVGVITVVLFLFGIRTWLWSPAWKSEESLAWAMLAADPGYDLGHNDLGTSLLQQGKYEDAEREFREAIRLTPGFSKAHNNLGFALGRRGKFEDAIAEYRAALRLKPDYAEAHNNLGVALGMQGKTEEAIAEYREAIRLNPDYAMAHYNLGTALGQHGKLEGAVAELQEAIRLNPDYAEALENLALALDEQGKRKEAREFWRRAEKLEVRPEWMERIKNRLAEPK